MLLSSRRLPPGEFAPANRVHGPHNLVIGERRTAARRVPTAHEVEHDERMYVSAKEMAAQACDRVVPAALVGTAYKKVGDALCWAEFLVFVARSFSTSHAGGGGIGLS